MGSSIPSISLANLTAISFIFLTHCAALHYAQNESYIFCPVFNCGNLTNITYPFTDPTNPTCGLSIISCVNGSIPIIQFQAKKAFFKVNSIFYNNQTVVIADQQFTNIIQESIDCRSLYNFSGNLVSSSLSFQLMSPTLTLFNCNRNTYFNPLLFDDFYGYGGCSNYDIFFYGNTNQSLCRPIGCQVFQFPVHGELSQFDGDNYWGDNLPSLLAKGFSLRWSFPSLCNDCTRKGNRCLKKTNGSFICAAGLDDGGDFVAGFNETRSNRTPKIAVIVVPVVVIGTIVTSIILFCCKRRKFSPVNLVLFWKRRTKTSKNLEDFLKNCASLAPLVLFWKRRTKTSKNLEDFLKNCASLAPKRYSYSEIKKMTDSFKDKLGQGGFGGVYKGKLHDNGGFVAVKVLNESKGNGEDFINEVASISRTSHVNIVSLMGFCLDGPNRALIYEFMPNGSLEKFIYNENQLRGHPQLGWERLHRIAVGIARGLEYLHRGCKTRILHFDIKPHNILLDEDFCPKIADFGLAKLCLKKESIVSMAGARGTAGYIAPEVFYRSFGGVSHKSDVYSYGMMILEMVGGRKNIDAEADHISEIYFPHWIHRRLELDESLGLHVTTEEEEELARKMILVGLWCIQTHPTNRPSISKVLEMLEGSVESLQIPPKPFLSSPPRSPAGSSTASIS